MGIEVKTISWWDTLRLQLFLTVPAFFWGFVVPNRLFVALLSRWNAGRWTMRFLAGLRRKYGCDHLWGRFPLRRTLLVLDPKTVDEVLGSDENAADPDPKKRALARFAPDALVISSGEAWQDRRRFNESVLAFGRLHPHHDAFKEIVSQAVGQLSAERSRALRWPDFQALGQRISHQVLLGSGKVDPELAAELERLARRGNWLVLPPNRRDFAAFYGRVDRELGQHRARLRSSDRGPQASGQAGPTRCLMHESAKLLEAGSATASTRVPSQIGFWFYVLKDAIELHVARTLALIAAHRAVQDRIRHELRMSPKSTAQAIHDFSYLEACLDEQLRLWTPVPILLRRAVKPFRLRGEVPIHDEEQLLIHAGFYHRDARFFGERADTFAPDSASGASVPVYFFSRDRQSCAGESLAKFLLKAALVALLERSRFELIAPEIPTDRVPYLYDHFKIELRFRGDG